MTDTTPLVYFLIPVMIFLGMRHAVDVDHVTAIDNLVRMNNANRRSRLVGTAFSAGHMSAVLFEMVCIILLVGTIAGAGGVNSSGIVKGLQFWGGIVGAIALSIVGGANLYSMKKWGKTGSAILAGKIHDRTRFLGTLGSATVTGFVFGLGFDTATQISAVTLSAVTSATAGVSMALILFAFFAFGMIPTDTLDSFVLREGFHRIMGTDMFRYLSYGLSGIALLVAFSESYGVLFDVEFLPPFTGAVLAVGFIGSTFAYALVQRHRESTIHLPRV